jgi:hypothetical protein
MGGVSHKWPCHFTLLKKNLKENSKEEELWKKFKYFSPCKNNNLPKKIL